MPHIMLTDEQARMYRPEATESGRQFEHGDGKMIGDDRHQIRTPEEMPISPKRTAALAATDVPSAVPTAGSVYRQTGTGSVARRAYMTEYPEPGHGDPSHMRPWGKLRELHRDRRHRSLMTSAMPS